MSNNSVINFRHPAWTVTQTPLGLELQYRNWRNRGSSWALIAVVSWSLFCLWGVWGFLKNWFIDKAEILPAGVVLCLILVGGCWLGIVLAGNLYERRVYLLSGERFKLRKHRINRPVKETVIDKLRIKEVYRLYTPPKETSTSGTWRTVIGYSDMHGKSKELALDGHSEEEADFVGPLFAEWARVKIVTENTVE